MKLDLADVLAELAVPDRTLAFCDEINLTDAARPPLVANLRMHAGFVVGSNAYADIVGDLAAFLEQHGLPEFHATEVVNGKKDSAWRSVPMDLRIEAFERIAAALLLPGSRIPYLYLSAEQYADINASAGGVLVSDFRTALKTVFLSSMTDYLPAPSSLLVMDRDKNTPGPTIHPTGSNALILGGAISVESHRVIGLQIADMATYVVRRHLLKSAQLGEGKGSAFDWIAAETVASFHGRFDHLLLTEKLAA